MKLPRAVGMAVAVSLVTAPVAALAYIGGAAPASRTAKVVDADVSLVKPLPCTKQFGK